jgi:hypothetical protein
MGLLKIGAYLKEKGEHVELLDCSIPARLSNTGGNLKTYYKHAPFVRMVKCGNYEQEGISKGQKYYGLPHRLIEQRIKAAQPTEIWIGSGLTYYWESVRDIAITAKRIYPDVPVLLGGIYPTLYPKHSADNIPADFIQVGPMDDIDDYFPDYSLYTDTCDTTRTVQLGKGCNVSPPCSFCAVVAMDPKFKSVAADKTFAYFKKEYEKNHVNFFRIWSSQLLVPRSRFKNLMKMVIESEMKINLVASEGVQPSLFDQETSDLMYKAGFVAVSIPMESIDDDMVDSFRKPSDFNDYEGAVANAQRSGFKDIKSFVMLGIPGQTLDEMVKGIVHCWANDTIPALHQYTPIPGSHDWTIFKQFHDKSPEELHPSLWPGASPDMPVQMLEEIKKIAGVGPYRLMDAYRNSGLVTVQYVWDAFIKWSRHYGIVKGDQPTNERPLVLPGYMSAQSEYFKNHGISNRKTDQEPTCEAVAGVA